MSNRPKLGGKKPTRPKRINISKSKYKYALYKLIDTIQLPQQFGSTVLVKGQTVIMPSAIVSSNIAVLIKPLEQCFKEVSSKTNLDNKNVLIIRNGGIGDILASLFGIVELKRKYSNINVGYLAEYKNIKFINGFPNIIDFPAVNIIPYEKIKHFTHMVYLEDLVETRNDLNIQDLFASKMNVNLFPATLVTLKKYFCPTKFERSGIGIHYHSNAAIRNYNLDHIIELINKLTIIYPNKPIHLLGPPNDYLHVNYIQVNTKVNLNVNGCGSKSTTILDAFGIVRKLELVISVDSSMAHIAGLTDTPLIGLFGPFHSSKRLSYYTNTIGINGKTSCSPCNRHDPQSFCKFTNGEGICLNSITPDLIIENVRKLIGDSK